MPTIKETKRSSENKNITESVVNEVLEERKKEGIECSLESMSIECTNKLETDNFKSVGVLNHHIKSSDISVSVEANCEEKAIITGVQTPVTIFKTREGIRTPGSRLTPNKRTSLSPNPQNFLSKIEDPIAQRIESPKSVADIKQDNIMNDVPKSAMYFHKLVEKEDVRFDECCAKWNEILKDGDIPEKAQGNILSAIGQALLFQNKRFKQFKELIELHKDKSAEKAAYASDLHGFWEMIYYQVEDVHKRFSELELLKSNNWDEKEVAPIKSNPVKKVCSKPKVDTSKKMKKPVVSKFKMFRQQMMAKKLSEQQQTNVETSG